MKSRVGSGRAARSADARKRPAIALVSAGNRAPGQPEELGQTESTIPCPSCDKPAPFVITSGGSGKTVRCPVCGPVRVIDIDTWDDDVAFLPAAAPEPEAPIAAAPVSSQLRSSLLSPLAIRGAGAVIAGLFGLVVYQNLIARPPTTESDLSRVETPRSVEAPIAPVEAPPASAPAADLSEPPSVVAELAEPMAAPAPVEPAPVAEPVAALQEVGTSIAPLTAEPPVEPVSAPQIAVPDLASAAPAKPPVAAPPAPPPAVAPVVVAPKAKPATSAPAPRAEVRPTPGAAPAEVEVAAIPPPAAVASKAAPPEVAKTTDQPRDDGAATKTAEGELPNGAVAPKPLDSNPAPRYPQMARRTGKAGAVVLRIMVTAEGSVTDIKVLEGQEPFVGAAIKAVRKWRYEPAQHQGRAIGVYRTIRLGFALRRPSRLSAR